MPTEPTDPTEAVTAPAAEPAPGPAPAAGPDPSPAAAQVAPRSARPDAVAAAAVEQARSAALEVGGDQVGEHLGVAAEGERLVSHRFAADVPGYQGWHWTVTVARAPRAKVVTVDEVVLLPGPSALLAPAWVPWDERVQPGDLSPGDLLPPPPGDPRLVPAYAAGDDGDEQERQVAFELGLGRVQVLSRDGRLEAADRWETGEFGADTAMARHAPARCGTCGYVVSLAGSLRAAFGVCGNEYSPADGRVVAVAYGCGAHSDTVVDAPSPAQPSGVVYDDGALV